uniref:RING-type E3 ubiquitin transferase n=1 Tax=Aegilops tauschii subsp. strangulata TaxID=200361 RepID=A0A453FSS2_AEGTS
GAPARQRANTRVAPVQGRVPPAGSRQDDSMNTFRCPPRPLPYDDPQFRHQTERHPLVAGHDKASTQSQKSKLLEENNDADTRSTCADQKADGPSLKDQSGGKKIGGAQVCVPSDSEDDCPICLEEYDYENPKIVLQCNHNFHLSCIYEWMERSQSCAVCAKGNVV